MRTPPSRLSVISIDRSSRGREKWLIACPAARSCSLSLAIPRLCREARSMSPIGRFARLCLFRHGGELSNPASPKRPPDGLSRSEEHTSELQSHSDLVCRLLLEK